MYRIWGSSPRAALERRPQPSQEAQMEEQPAHCKSLHPS